MGDEEVLCRFGTPLEPLEEDEIPSKKPILIEDQIVTDENGRRRFHGAFTGGFSAGFWNTVGSLEGWTPKEFKSSRDEKFKISEQKPTDFMDDEDFGEFGIAPQRVQTTADFTATKNSKEAISKKRKSNKTIDGPIPGVPVLHQLLESSKDNIAMRLLKKMGWKEGQGIGARQTKKEKKTTAKQNFQEQYILKKYGCEIGPIATSDKSDSDESDISEVDEITFAPDDFEPYVCATKDNCFGIGYSGLSREPVLKQHINLFGPLEILDKNQKLSIRGKGFGVGALEEEDEDIYHHDDMSNYDFSIDKSLSSQKNKIKQPKIQDFHVIEGFSSKSEANLHAKKVFIINIPPNFIPRNWLVRKSRFDPLDEKKAALLKQQDNLKIKGLGRHDITTEERGAILDGTNKKPIEKQVKPDEANQSKKTLTYLEKINEKYKRDENKKDKVLNMLALRSDNFVKSEIITEDGTISKSETHILSENVQAENEHIRNEASKITKSMESTTPTIFKPFMGDSSKQERYEKFVNELLPTDEDVTKFLRSIQPENMSEWDRQMEKKEFEQARKIYKPLRGIMSDRFITETAVIAEKEKVIHDPDRRGKTIRTKSIWHPASIVCKRFNIAEPFVNVIKEEKPIKKPKLSVFDYLEGSVNKKEDFVTPVVIPTNEEIQKSNSNQIAHTKRLSAKDMFSKEIKLDNNSTLLEKEEQKTKCNSESESMNDAKIIVEDVKNNNNKTIEKLNKPKSVLEQKIEELKNKHPSEKKELYKNVFGNSSDDSDDDTETNNSDNKNKARIDEEDQIKQSCKSTDLISALNRPAGELNILRNNSPPRGIFAAFFKDPPKSQGFNIVPTQNVEIINDKNGAEPQLEKIKFKSKEERQKVENEDSLNVYGPIMPSKIISNTTITETQSEKIDSSTTNLTDTKLSKILSKHKKIKIVEEWVEITNIKTKESKTTKKDKKKKKKKEKSKHRTRSSSSSDTSSSSSNNEHRTKKKSKKSKKNKKHRK